MQKVKAFGDWLTKWFTAIVIVWAVFNYFVPQASLWGKSYTGYFLGIVLFGMGLTLTLDDFKHSHPASDGHRRYRGPLRHHAVGGCAAVLDFPS